MKNILSRIQSSHFFIIIIIWQLLLLSGLLFHSFYPLIFGKQVKIKVLPIDPRSLFRGNYVRLSYSFSGYKGFDGRLQKGETVYIKLKKNNDYYDVDMYTLKKPSEGLFLQSTYTKQFRTKLIVGIESYFTTKEQAIEIENKIRNQHSNLTAFALIKVTNNGQAALKDIVFE